MWGGTDVAGSDDRLARSLVSERKAWSRAHMPPATSKGRHQARSRSLEPVIEVRRFFADIEDEGKLHPGIDGQTRELAGFKLPLGHRCQRSFGKYFFRSADCLKIANGASFIDGHGDRGPPADALVSHLTWILRGNLFAGFGGGIKFLDVVDLTLEGRPLQASDGRTIEFDEAGLKGGDLVFEDGVVGVGTAAPTEEEGWRATVAEFPAGRTLAR